MNNLHTYISKEKNIHVCEGVYRCDKMTVIGSYEGFNYGLVIPPLHLSYLIKKVTKANKKTPLLEKYLWRNKRIIKIQGKKTSNELLSLCKFKNKSTKLKSSHESKLTRQDILR